MTRLPVLATAAAALLTAAAFGRVGPDTRAPLVVLESGHPVANLTVGAVSGLPFIVDTAATRTVILPAFAEAYGRVLRPRGQARVPGASGEAALDVITLDALTVAGRHIPALEAWRLPPGPVDRLRVVGVLGADVLTRYVVEMDPAAGTWSLSDAHADRPGLVYRPFVLDAGQTPLMSMQINGVALTAVIDTGAQASILNAAAADRLGLGEASPGAVAAGAARGTDGGAMPTVSHCLSAVSVDGRATNTHRVRVADLPVFGSLGLSDRPAMILGYDLLGRRSIVIDYPNNRIGFGPEPPEASCA